MVKYYLTQNIDNLEEQAGFTQNQIIQSHGGNFGAICAKCGETNDRSELDKKISAGEVMYCSKTKNCLGPVKPKITFFGEDLPEKFISAQ